MIEYAVLYLVVGMFFATVYNVLLPRAFRIVVGWPGLLIPQVRRYYQGYHDARVKLIEVGNVDDAYRSIVRIGRHRKMNEWYVAGYSDALKESK